VASTPLDTLRSDAALDRLLAQPSISDCDYSPDGKTIMLLKKGQDGIQIHLVDVATRQSRQLTHETGGIKSVCWKSNDTLLFTEDRDGNEKTQIYRIGTAAGSTPEALTDNPNAIHHFAAMRGTELLYASNERDAGLFDTYIKDVATGQKRMVYKAEAPGIYPRGFSKDGQSLLLSRSYSNGHNDLLLLDLASGKTRNLTSHLGEAKFSNTRWVRNNSLTLLTDAGRDKENVAVFNLDTGKLKYVTNAKWDAETVRYTRDSRYRVTCLNEDGYSRFHVYDRTQKHEVALRNMPDGQVVAQDFAPDGKSMVFCLSQSTQPSSLWRLDLQSGEVKPFMPTPGPLPSLQGTVAPQLVRYSTFDGKQIPAFLYTPGGPTDPAQHHAYPTVVYVHGGPEGQHRPAFDSTVQYLVSRGFQVLAPNVRGSKGYGRAYSHADDVDKRMDSVEDVASAARWLSDTGRADRDEIAVMGGSYGGYMTLAQLAFHPELWAAGVDIVGMSNLETFLRNTGAWRRANREAEYGSLSRDLELLRRVSPLNSVDRIEAPLMVIQGANDPRVPQSEADQIVEHVRGKGGVAEYLLFKDEGHGIAKRPNRVKAYTAAADFLSEHLRSQAS
jgi:dipeptidyl aminopeptidase/acylaminoacyl peptidase